ncbi:MAG: RDD family protein [Acidobacteriota bacterium]
MTTAEQPQTQRPEVLGAPDDGAGGPDPGILSLDNVRLDLPLAGVGSRVLAMSVDMALSWLAVILVVIATLALASTLGTAGGWLIAFLSLATFLVQWGYFAFFEITLEGQTPGKMLVGLRTVSHLGGRPSNGAFLTRNFLRTFDLIFGLPLMASDARSRRLGDLIARTLVVHDRAGTRLRLGAVPASWSAREISLAESFFERESAMEPEVAGELASRLLDWLQRTQPDFVGQAPLDSSALECLRALLKPEQSTAS